MSTVSVLLRYPFPRSITRSRARSRALVPSRRAPIGSVCAREDEASKCTVYRDICSMKRRQSELRGGTVAYFRILNCRASELWGTLELNRVL